VLNESAEKEVVSVVWEREVKLPTQNIFFLVTKAAQLF